ncbi:hypothetical protein ATY81_09530 [Rhizobium sp. R72]|uniref:DUF1127 domain-containing protein n=1 Tax=unclassified Rhizobium TaxID=2613769 RepID=UPI000B53023F|nr:MULTISPECIES: DUF1127 domain-containing protein [unclassified Rhizobium]OWV86633.1 hypothetical protein ATY79_07345 [Rhizobium sp. R693]OWV95411.1 hypothetical protein ATY81_09530 [Rhizobium sp. R72]OWV95711.1 hypothetical protein ATY80_09530 [Rhizobium sp. R711]
MSAVQENEPLVAPLSSQVQSMQYRVSQRAGHAPHTWIVWQSVWRRLSSWHQKRESRKALLDLTDDELLDIGVTRADARKEASKSFFWD